MKMEAVICVIITGVFTLTGTIISTKALHRKSEEKFAVEWAMIKRDMDEVKGEVKEVKSQISDLTDTEKVCDNLSLVVKDIKDNIEEVNANLNQLKAESSQNDAILKTATMCMIRHVINQSHKAFMKAGCIDEKSKESLLALGNVYLKDLKGNSFVKSEINDIEKLPIKWEG